MLWAVVIALAVLPIALWLVDGGKIRRLQAGSATLALWYVGIAIFALIVVLIPSISEAGGNRTYAIPSRQELRNSSGKPLGVIIQRSDGKLEGRDASGRVKGFYDPKSNQTWDSSGKPVGKGNMLSGLVIR